MYTIELARWNISQGLPVKPYTNADYLKADANILGINNALAFAKNNGYSGAVLPKGNYAICYPRVIKMISNFIFDLNGSTLKVIFDSDRKSPFDSRKSADFYNFKGNSIEFENVTDAHLKGGTIIGCREDRSFVNPEERRMEHSYGVVFAKSTKYSSLKNCTVRDYMGDNVTFTSSSFKELAGINFGFTLNSLEYTTGKPVASADSLTSAFIPIPTDVTFSSFLIAGAGYTRLTALATKEADVFFYRADNSFIGVLKRRKIYQDISIPAAASKMRFVFFNETNPAKNMQITLKFGLIPHHNLVEQNEIFNGHRGGITLGGSYNAIQYNTIRDNGKASSSFLDGKPTFNDSTRYGINQEDSYGDSNYIRNNLIYGSNNGILAGCYTIFIENNHIYNMDGIGINLYSLSFANIKGNFIYNCSTNIGLMSSNFDHAFVNILENSFKGGNFSFGNNSSYQINFTDNNLVDVPAIHMGTSRVNNTFKNNRLKYVHMAGAFSITAYKLEDCIIDSAILRDCTSKVYEFKNCTFNNLKITIQTINGTSEDEAANIQESSFFNCLLTNLIFGTKNRELNLYNCKLVDTVTKVGNINTPGYKADIYLENCEISSNSLTYFFATDLNQPSGSIKVTNSKISIKNPSFSYLTHHDKPVVASVFTLFLKNLNITYSGGGTKTIAYYNNVKPIKNMIFSENKVSNILFPAADPGIFVSYDIENTFKTTVNLTPEGNSYTAAINHNLGSSELFIQCIAQGNQLVHPVITIVSPNVLQIKYHLQTPLFVTVKKI
ncbi:right-handed parallel beta-helix repeat-containing protein [Metabacillus sp. SLBN-84]